MFTDFKQAHSEIRERQPSIDFASIIASWKERVFNLSSTAKASTIFTLAYEAPIHVPEIRHCDIVKGRERIVKHLLILYLLLGHSFVIIGIYTDIYIYYDTIQPPERERVCVSFDSTILQL